MCFSHLNKLHRVIQVHFDVNSSLTLRPLHITKRVFIAGYTAFVLLPCFPIYIWLKCYMRETAIVYAKKLVFLLVSTNVGLGQMIFQQDVTSMRNEMRLKRLMVI